MKKSRFFNPYSADGKKTNLRPFVGLSGVYIIRSEKDGKFKYIGYSGTDLYKTITRHFQSWVDFTQVRTTFSKNGFTVRVILCTPARAALLEAALIKRYSPSDNPLLLKGKLTRREYSILEEYEEKPALKYDEVAPF